ncbi:hypothetical protein HGO34_06935 [Agrobacterium vitis]|uniref:DUF2214 domain-containing protein n=1 Tax=Agrobacterium vitis TaxID=373 RepID=A0AAE4WCN4_AGRVI|nr:hypothetical protein [Agrobacterium vitis]MCF1499302.1 hypothetical protein [Allorhizobium sp. Av2]MCM2439450.1 hypothetical protein [Agrobacterium vitis]MUZ57649.1 hypothetical protein [Agrobacterium vitis]
MDAYLHLVETWQPVLQFRSSVWAYPIASWVHLVGLAMLFGTITAVDLGLIGIAKNLRTQTIRSTLIPMALTGFGIAVASGLLLFAPAAREYANSSYFLVKIGLIVVAGANAILLHQALRRGVPDTAIGCKLLGTASIAIWGMVIFCGRMLAFG